MMPTAHLAVTYIIWWFLHKYWGADVFSLFLGVILGVLIDGDAVFLGSKHRASPLHSYAWWILAIIVLYALGIPYYWTPIFALAHLALDSLDYEVYLAYPITKRTIGLKIASKHSDLIPGKNSLIEFAKHYATIKIFLVLEIIFGVVAIILFLSG